MIADGILSWDDLAMVRTSSSTTVVADFVSLLGTAMVGSRPLLGQPVEGRGPFTAPDGAQFHTASDFSLAAHPPWKSNVGGVAYARYVIDLPDQGRLRLVTDVAMARDTVGQNHADGVTFGIQVTSGEDRLACEIHNDTESPKSLELDLTAMAGRRATVELTVHPGPNGSPSYDSTIWGRPRIEQDIETEGTVGVDGTQPWEMAIGATGSVPIKRHGTGQQVSAMLPGSVFFLRQKPLPVRLPVEVAGLPRRVGTLGYHGVDEELSSFVGVRATESTVGGVTRGGLFAHPPNDGSTMAAIPMRLPPEPAVFESFIGIRDGADSTGVIFSVEVNGRAIAQRRMLPGKWERIEADLSRWKGQPVVLALITDSDGSYTCDWAQWGEPRIVTP